VCKTPSPAGPIPIPYVNIAKTSDLADGSKKVKIEKNPAALKSSNLSMSSGDEPGSAGGIISSKIKGKATWATSSMDVKIEGKGAVRFLDVVQHNGNSFNTAFIQMGGTGFAYGDDFEDDCTLCGKPPDKHRVLELKEGSAKEAAEILKKLHQDPPKYLKVKRTIKPGFMVGVLVCNCKKWATTSGNTPGPFGDAAPGCEIVKGGKVSAADLGGDDEAAVKKIQDGFDLATQKRADGEEGYSFPGACAATKLMKAAKGHEMLSMTEVYFQGGETWVKDYDVLKTKPTVPQTKGPMSFRGFSKTDADRGATNRAVASCHSCQLIVPFTLCKLEDWQC
jgi:hypothetical protein